MYKSYEKTVCYNITGMLSTGRESSTENSYKNEDSPFRFMQNLFLNYEAIYGRKNAKIDWQ
jgi:hypothetical protein